MTLISKFDPWGNKMCTCPPKLSFNPYSGCDHNCIYCYASSYIPNFKECRPKNNLLKNLLKEALKLKGEIISISNSSDPYPRLEKKALYTRSCLQILAKSECKIQIVTKSNVVVRDIDLLKKNDSTVTLTITTDDEKTAKIIEPNAPTPHERILAIRELVKKGIPVSARIDPIIPFLNDKPENLIQTLADIGVKHITSSTYKVRRDNWRRFEQNCTETSKKLKSLYFVHGERIGGYWLLPRKFRFDLMKKIGAIAETKKIKFGVCREGFTQLNRITCDGSWLLNRG